MSDSTFHNNQGIALAEKGLLGQAAQSFCRALELAPDDPQVLGNLGVMLMKLQQFDQAISVYQSAIRVQPDAGQSWGNLGLAYRSIGKLEQSIAAYRRAIELMPDTADVHMNLCVALEASAQVDQAIAAYRRAIDLAPNLANAHYNLGKALAAKDDLEFAVTAYHRAIALHEDFAAAYSNLGTALQRLGRHEEAMAAYNRGIQIDPNSAKAHWNRSLALLLQGNYSEGWQEYERRKRMSPPTSQMFPQPQWRGEGLAGRTILLHAEHGLGDVVMMARYVPLVAAQGGKVVLHCNRELAELFKGLAGVSQLIVEGDPLPVFDLHCPMMSLPLAFATALDSIPCGVPYLFADPVRVQRCRATLGSTSNLRRVGLVWAGSPEHQYDRQRSIPLSAFAPLQRIAGAQFFSLQKGPEAKQANESGHGLNLVDCGDLLDDYADTAALISELDLVISVDTSVAHVAAAMGKPVWLLIAFAPDWRWLLDRDNSPWYPTIKIFRQPNRGDWSTVIQRLTENLNQLGVY